MLPKFIPEWFFMQRLKKKYKYEQNLDKHGTTHKCKPGNCLHAYSLIYLSIHPHISYVSVCHLSLSLHQSQTMGREIFLFCIGVTAHGRKFIALKITETVQ